MNLNFRQTQAEFQNQNDQTQWGKGIFHCNGLGCKRTKKAGPDIFLHHPKKMQFFN